MRTEILEWYAYSESGLPAAVAEDSDNDQRLSQRQGEQHCAAPRSDLSDPAAVSGLFAQARRLDAHVDARGWRRLFSEFGLHGLIDLAKGRRSGWPSATSEETVADAIVSESLDAGYDPVSGLIGTYVQETKRFEPEPYHGHPAHAPRSRRESNKSQELIAARARH